MRRGLAILFFALFVPFTGQALLPGLMDNHLHGAGGGPGVDLSRARSLADVAAGVPARSKTANPGDVGAGQRVGRGQAIRMATISNAWLMMEEQDKGSIEPGKLAELIVLDEDPLTCPEPRLRDAQVMMTVVGGKTVFER